MSRLLQSIVMIYAHRRSNIMKMRLVYVCELRMRCLKYQNGPFLTIQDQDYSSRTLHSALNNLSSCVEALKTPEHGKRRCYVRQLLHANNLHVELLKAESRFNQALLEVNHDNTAFIANHIAKLEKCSIACSCISLHCDDLESVPFLLIISWFLFFCHEVINFSVCTEL